jgi:hypothetical protein
MQANGVKNPTISEEPAARTSRTAARVHSGACLPFPALVRGVGQRAAVRVEGLAHERDADQFVGQPGQFADAHLNFLHGLEGGGLIVSEEEDRPDLPFEAGVQRQADSLGCENLLQ